MDTRRFILVVSGVLALLLPGRPFARADVPTAVADDRQLANIDFEERRLGNVEDQPMHWSKLTGAGLPRYVGGRLTTDRARGGKYSFRIDLDGGSCLYRYDAGRIQVQRGGHYRVTVYCQTTTLLDARAQLCASFADPDGRPVPGSEVRSAPFVSTTITDEPAADWRPITVELTANNPDDASIVLELGLLQPGMLLNPAAARAGSASADPLSSPAATLDEGTGFASGRPVFLQDIRGTAWFDDLTVFQVPQVMLETGRPGNVFRSGDPVTLQVAVNDRETADLAVQLLVRNAAGKAVFQRTGALDASAGAAAPSTASNLSTASTTATATTLPAIGQTRVALPLPPLPPGWYEATLAMTSRGRFVGRQQTAFIALPVEAQPSAPDTRFGVVATRLPFDAWTQLPKLMPLIGAGRVKLAVWSEAGDVQHSHADEFDQVVDDLQLIGVTPTACLTAIPPRVSARWPSHAWSELLRANPADWQNPLSYLIARHATRVDHWQIGADDYDGFATGPRMHQVYEQIYAQFAELVQRPNLSVAWPAWCELGQDRPTSVVLSVPTSILPGQIPLYLQDTGGASGPRSIGPPHASRGTTGSAVVAALAVSSTVSSSVSSTEPLNNVSLSLQTLDVDRYGRLPMIRDFAQRVIFSMAAGAQRIDLPFPFTTPADGAEQQPAELLLIERSLVSTLGGAVYRGRVPVADGVDAFLFERHGTGILALWDRGNLPGVKRLAINLGERPRRVDLWGNVTPLLAAESRPDAGEATGSAATAGSGKMLIPVGSMPTFLIDVDAQVARLRASVGFDQPLIESRFEPHTRKLHFTNPYPQAISGMVRLRPPEGWTLNPPTINFNLNPGEVFDRDVTLEFPYNSFAGRKTVEADFRLQADRNSVFSVPIPLVLGLSDVGTESMAVREASGEVMVQQIITNYSEQPISYTAFAVCPGQPREERLVTDLGPGRTTIKRYRFPKDAVGPSTRIRTGLKELEGSRVLNDLVEVK